MAQSDSSGPVGEEHDTLKPAWVVGIGASAGGLQALRAMLSALRPGSACAFVVCQHLAPGHGSSLVELLAKEAPLPVRWAESGSVLRAEEILVLPPGCSAELCDGRLVLGTPAPGHPSPSVDELFRSMAEESESAAIGVVLSGGGRDGADGVHAIRAAGGRVLVQRPDEATQPGMPQRAIAAGADLQLGAAEIAEWLNALGIARDGELARCARDIASGEFTQLLQRVRDVTEMDVTQYKEATLLRQIDKRCRALDVASVGEYLEHVERHPEELFALQQSFLISVTSFFRDPDAFHALDRVLRELLRHKRDGDALRVWVPGCASGEEAYSVAILLLEALGERRNRLEVRVFATDVDAQATEQARRGCYPAQALAAVEPRLREHYFRREGEAYRVCKELRELCVFSIHDVIRHPAFIRMDVVSCRNLLIYFKPALQDALFNSFHYALNPGGYLLLGKSESVGPGSRLFSTADARNHLFRRKAARGGGRSPLGQRRPFLPVHSLVGQTPSPAARSLPDKVQEVLAGAYAPASVLVNSGFETLHFFGNLKPYLQLPDGAADFGLFGMAQPELRAELKRLAYRMLQEGSEKLVSPELLLPGSSGLYGLRLVLRRVPQVRSDGDPLLLVSFEPVEASAAAAAVAAPSSSASGDLAGLVMRLEGELSDTREHLQTVIEELEASNEEMLSLNEEMQSSSEELQSSNEELQSSNEELTTLNDELHAKSQQLLELNATLSNIQESVRMGLVVVDRDGRVGRYNAMAVRVFGLMPADIGQHLVGLPCYLKLPALREHLAQVIGRGEVVTERASRGEHHYLMQISPYMDDSGRRTGAVLSFTDISDLHRAERAQARSEGLLQLIADAVPALIAYVDAAGCYRMANRCHLDWFGRAPESALGCALREVLGEPAWREFEPRVAQVLGGAGSVGFEIRMLCQGGVWRDAMSVLVPDLGPDGAVRGFALLINDVTPLKESEASLRAERDRSARYLDTVEAVILVLDPEGQIQLLNRKACTLLDYAYGELRGQDWLSRCVPKDSQAAVEAALDGLLHGESSAEYHESAVVTRHGEERMIAWHNAVLRDAAGRVEGLLCAGEDITERIRAETALRLSEERAELLAALLENSSQPFAQSFPGGRFGLVNNAFCTLTGYAREELEDVDWARKLTPPEWAADEAERLRELARRGAPIRYEKEFLRKDGRRVPVELFAHVVRDAAGQTLYYYAFVTDVTTRRETEARIRSLASFDALTGLPNRRLFTERLGQAIANNARNGQYGALLFIDLDHFKTLNDTQGHDVGDRLLVEVGKRLRARLREGDTVARLGGDEFVVLAESLGEREELAAAHARGLAEEIRHALGRPFYLAAERDTESYTSPSIGVSLFHDPTETSEELLKRADLALYQAKDAGRNTVRFFSHAMQQTLNARAELESALRQALARDELRLHYQPQVDAEGALIGYEALLRWHHPARGLVSPGEFIPLAEQTGLILPIGAWVLEVACRRLAAWRSDPAMIHLQLAVNVSAAQFRQPDFVAQVRSVLESSAIDPSRLKLELTESVLLEQIEEAIARMGALRAMGVGWSMDDFGTGYSSLAYLKRLPLDQLKIDQSFVRDITTDPDDAAIVQAIIALSRALGIRVIAEGVETEAQRDFLLANGCSTFQGYLFGRPAPLGDLVPGH